MIHIRRGVPLRSHPDDVSCHHPLQKLLQTLFPVLMKKKFTLPPSIFLSPLSRFLSPVKLSSLYSYKAIHKAAVPRCAWCAKSVKVKRHLSAARIGCNTAHLLPSLLLLSSSLCLPKIGQLWTMWPQVTGGEGLHTITPTHTHTLCQVCSYCVAKSRVCLRLDDNFSS